MTSVATNANFLPNASTANSNSTASSSSISNSTTNLNNDIGLKQTLLMRSLSDFFNKEPKNMSCLLDLIVKQKKNCSISLRIVDWFVTNYAKEKDISYQHPRTGKTFHVYDNYKAELKSHSKKQFDPFCRRIRIIFNYTTNGNNVNKLKTTVGQLNFFRWAIENEIIQYIQQHYNEINNNMNIFKTNTRKNKKKTTPSSSTASTTTTSTNNSDNDDNSLNNSSIGTNSSDSSVHIQNTNNGATKKKNSQGGMSHKIMTKSKVKTVISFD